VHLETAALDPEALAHCIAQIDHLSADYKLPGTLQSGFYGPQHVACCTIAAQAGITVDVKLVLTADLQMDAFAAALAELTPLQGQVLVVLQPVTPHGEVQGRLPDALLQRCIAATAAAGFDYRVLPQTHKQLQVR
jgi:organic radical activating enzyme